MQIRLCRHISWCCCCCWFEQLKGEQLAGSEFRGSQRCLHWKVICLPAHETCTDAMRSVTKQTASHTQVTAIVKYLKPWKRYKNWHVLAAVIMPAAFRSTYSGSASESEPEPKPEPEPKWVLMAKFALPNKEFDSSFILFFSASV